MTGRRILVTNDDGIDSPGLHALALAMQPLGEVTVFAPSREYSGAGAGIGHIGDGIADVHEVHRPELEGLAAYCFDGPPALAALLALQGLFGWRPDLVVSGINPGWNVGLAVHFSGTIGAVITAEQLGVPGLAVSQQTGEVQHWQTAAAVAADIAMSLGPDAVAYNVNVPNIEASLLVGTRWTGLGNRIPYRMRNARLEPAGLGRHAVQFDRDGHYDTAEGTDSAAVEAGFAAITRLRPTGAW